MLDCKGTDGCQQVTKGSINPQPCRWVNTGQSRGTGIGECPTATIAVNIVLAGLSYKQGLARPWMEPQANVLINVPRLIIRLKDIIPRLTDIAFIRAHSVSYVMGIACHDWNMCRVYDIAYSLENNMDSRPQFKKHNSAIQRQAKIVQLDKIKTPEARKEHKGMFTFRIGRTKINTSGFYEKAGKHPVRCK